MMISKYVALGCPADAAFRAFTRGEDILRWWGDEAIYRTVEWQADVRPGGAWKATFASPDGQRFTAFGDYRAVQKPSTLVWSFAADWAPGKVKQITMRFAGAPGGSVMTFASDGHTDADDRLADERGWDQIIGWFSAYLRDT